MAQQQNLVVSTHPPPPKRFYHNCATNRPTPPPPPTGGTYQMFGRVYSTEDVQPTLEEAGRQQLFDSSKPPIAELRRLNNHLLHLFTQLINALCSAAALSADQQTGPHDDLVRQIGDVFINMQYLINMLRPTQAAHDLRILLDRQTAARRTMAERLRAAVSKSWDLVADAADRLAEPPTDIPPDSVTAAAMARAAISAPRPLSSTQTTTNLHTQTSPTDTAAVPAVGENDAVDDDDDDVNNMPPRPPPEHLAAQLAHIMADPSL